jgi:antitoxin (DNA-binding transcriptional repressor) of toxin-antitoxin stability system
MNMQVVTSGKVQASFGEVAEVAKFGEPVTITQYGRPTLLLIRYQDGMDALRELAKKNMLVWMDVRQKNAPQAAFDLSEEELNNLVNDEISKA